MPFFEDIQRTLRIISKRLARLGKPSPPACSFEKRCPEFSLQVFDLLRKGRLRNEKFIGGIAEGTGRPWYARVEAPMVLYYDEACDGSAASR